MTKYKPKFGSVSEQIPIYSIQKGPRFQGNAEKNRFLLKNVPNQYHSKHFLDEEKGHHITRGKKWTLKMSKEDQTTPGPAYDTQYYNSVNKKVDDTTELVNGTFGEHKAKQKTIPAKGFQNEYLG